MHVAFVLLTDELRLDADLIAATYRELFPDHGPLVPTGENGGDEDGETSAIGLACADGVAHLVVVPGPVPGGEAERNAARSLAFVGQDPVLPEHSAHLVVPWSPADGASIPEGLASQARVTAAIALATGASGVYVGAASATHPADWYVEVARQVEAPIMLWVGVSHAVTDEPRHSFLSSGMHQFGQPDLLLTAPIEDGSDAIEYFYDLLLYTSANGRAITEGETVGRTEDERIVVRYEANPVDDERVVFCVDL